MNFFELVTPRDLFRKLESDYALLNASHQDTWVAFNFFVTAEHLPDWLKRRDLVRDYAILRVVSHLANGAKHLDIDLRRHRSVVATQKDRYVEEGYWESGYVEEPLLISLAPDEQRELGVEVITASDLGRRVLDFWMPYVAAA